MPHFICRRRLLVMALAIVTAWPNLAAAQPPAAAPPAMVILVRHADRASSADTSPLSASGVQRAKDLAAALRDARVTTIITTKKIRTRETAKPLAAATSLTPIELDGGVDETVKTVGQQAGRVVLVVGHSDTILPIITKLGGPSLPANICGATYDHLFVLVPTPTAVHFARARYGQPKSASGANCL